MNKYRLILGLFGLVGGAVMLRSHIFAQSATPSTGMTVSPPTFEVSANPGDTIKNTIKLDNLNDKSLRIAVDRRNFTAVGEEGTVGLTEEETSFSLASWIEVEPKEVTLAPKSTQYFTYKIHVPSNAEPGGHFGSIIFRTIPTESVQGSGASLSQEIGSLLLLKIAGETTELASIESFSASSPLFEYGPVSFTARLKNQGNVHVKPKGNIVITNVFGQNVGTAKIEPKNILPGAIRKMDGVWDTKWRFGYYTATFTAVFGDNDQRSSVTNFIVLPYRVLGLLLLLLLALIFFYRKNRKRFALALKVLRTGKA